MIIIRIITIISAAIMGRALIPTTISTINAHAIWRLQHLCFSIIAIASCSCIYVSIICGSLAMIFALLSKGGATSMSSMAMTSFWIAFAAVVITLIIYIGSFAAMLHEYGSIEGILKEYQNLTGIDYNELLKQMNTAK